MEMDIKKETLSQMTGFTFPAHFLTKSGFAVRRQEDRKKQAAFSVSQKWKNKQYKSVPSANIKN